MYIVNSYPIAVLRCVVSMLCWGFWANTQKLASKEWSFPLYCWDYTFSVIILSLIFGFTLGSSGENGQAFIPNFLHAAPKAFLFALLGGVIFNNYLPSPEAYHALYLFIGVGLITLIVVVNTLAYKKLTQGSKSTKGNNLQVRRGQFLLRFGSAILGANSCGN